MPAVARQLLKGYGGCNRNAAPRGVAVKTQSNPPKFCKQNLGGQKNNKENKVPPKFCFAKFGRANTRFLEFLAGVLSKGVWWMPRLKKAMKDAA